MARSSEARSGRHRRRRRHRLLHRLSSRQARLERRRAARAQTAHQRHDLACGGSRRSAASEHEHDAARALHRGSVSRARGRDRARPRAIRQCGSISLATTPGRMEELKRNASMAKVFGLPVHVVSPREIRRAVSARQPRRCDRRHSYPERRLRERRRHHAGARQRRPLDAACKIFQDPKVTAHPP